MNNLQTFLESLEKEEKLKKDDAKKTTPVFFLLPSGIVYGKFKKYNNDGDVREFNVVIHQPYFKRDEISLKEVSISVNIIQGWGRE